MSSRRKLSRRSFLTSMISLGAAMMLPSCQRTQRTPTTEPTAVPAKAYTRGKPQKPNILMIISDEHNAGVLGCYGNAIARTPNLDRLAREGVLFDSCYCNSPLCVPSRLSFTASKYASRVGAWNNLCWLPTADYPSLPRILNAAGYNSFLCGRMHYDATRRYGFTEFGDSPANNTLKTGKGHRRKADELTPLPGISERFDSFHPGEDSGIMKRDRIVTAGTTEFLAQRQGDAKPFFFLAGYHAPHFPLTIPEKYWEPFKGQIPMPEIPEGHLESQPRNYRIFRITKNLEDVPDAIVRKGRELYYGLTQWLDEEIGKVLKALDTSEVADNTVVIYTSDHGESMGEHGLWWKNCMYEHASRVPLIVSWPARWKGGQRRTEGCSLLDLAQTIAEISEATVPRDWNGDSLVRWMDDPKHEWKDLAVSEYYDGNIASGFAMIRRGKYKYVYHTPADRDHPAERELYDLRDDPGEFENLAYRNEHKDLANQMHLALIEEIGEDPDETELRYRSESARGYLRG